MLSGYGHDGCLNLLADLGSTGESSSNQYLRWVRRSILILFRITSKAQVNPLLFAFVSALESIKSMPVRLGHLADEYTLGQIFFQKTRD